VPDRRLLAPVLLVLLTVALALGHSGEIRDRAELALGSGMPEREAALARGFVLGEDDGIDARTVEDFRRAGLGHLLAVSGQNVTLLALLAMPVLAALGMPLRVRLVWILGLIALYVPLAGAGPTVVRAGVMGALGLLATLAGRRSSRLHALFLAVVFTLALEPGFAADVGWQLSFAAVIGILLLATPLREAIERRLGSRGWRRALAEGTALTVAATISTAPLVAFHFGAISVTTLLANLLVLPAVAPAMWLGMLVAAAGQVPGLPLGALAALEAPLLAYIAQVAAWCGRPGWAYPKIHLGLAGLAGSYLGIAAVVALALRLGRWRRIRQVRVGTAPGASATRLGWTGPRGRRWLGPAVALSLATVALAWPPGEPAGALGGPSSGLRVSVLDVGQGDAILLQPARAPAVLVDGGPPGDGVEGELRAAGVTRLGAAILTHDQADHAGGIRDLLGEMPVGRLLFAAAGRATIATAAAAGVPTRRLARGGVVRSGRLRLEALWPPPELLTEPHPGADPNALAIVTLARWGRFSMLLTADAEAETTPLDPGPVEVLKVAHHGSEDAGLAALLDRARPRLALISVGEGNPFGHPTGATLETLAAHGVRILRTDRDGTIVLDVGRYRFGVSAGD
jgi:competence protein ComEC